MPNDVSYFKVQGDNTTYSFNDANLENLVGSASMGTTATTVTGAIAEHESDIGTINTKIGNTSMGTTATTVTGAIKEHSDKFGSTPMGTTATTVTGAIAEHEGDISSLNSSVSTLNSKFIGHSFTGDLDSLKTTGIYILGANCSNTPAASVTSYGGYLVAFSVGGGAIQICWSSTGGSLYERITGRAWHQISLAT